MRKDRRCMHFNLCADTTLRRFQLFQVNATLALKRKAPRKTAQSFAKVGNYLLLNLSASFSSLKFYIKRRLKNITARFKFNERRNELFTDYKDLIRNSFFKRVPSLCNIYTGELKKKTCIALQK